MCCALIRRPTLDCSDRLIFVNIFMTSWASLWCYFMTSFILFIADVIRRRGKHEQLLRLRWPWHEGRSLPPQGQVKVNLAFESTAGINSVTARGSWSGGELGRTGATCWSIKIFIHRLEYRYCLHYFLRDDDVFMPLFCCDFNKVGSIQILERCDSCSYKE